MVHLQAVMKGRVWFLQAVPHLAAVVDTEALLQAAQGGRVVFLQKTQGGRVAHLQDVQRGRVVVVLLQAV